MMYGPIRIRFINNSSSYEKVTQHKNADFIKIYIHYLTHISVLEIQRKKFCMVHSVVQLALKI